MEKVVLFLTGVGMFLTFNHVVAQDINLNDDDINGVNTININDIGSNEGMVWPNGSSIYIDSSASKFQFNTLSDYPFNFEGGYVTMEGELDLQTNSTGRYTSKAELKLGSYSFKQYNFPAQGSGRLSISSSNNDYIYMYGENMYFGMSLPDYYSDSPWLQYRFGFDGAGRFSGHVNAASLSLGSVDLPEDYMLAVDGNIICEKVHVNISEAWPDYVFSASYDLMSLEDVAAYIDLNERLPGVPSAAEVEEKGVSLGDMQRLQMEKIEELTLHVIEINKEKEALEAELNDIKSMLNQLLEEK